MASDSFVNFTEADIKSFTEKQEIVNTKKLNNYFINKTKKTSYKASKQ